MPNVMIAKVRQPDDAAATGATHQLSISATMATIIVAAIGVVPALTTIVVDWAIKSPMAAQVQQADINVKNADADAKNAASRVERRRLEEAWLKSALSIADDAKRLQALKYLVASGLVGEEFKNVGQLGDPPHLVTTGPNPEAATARPTK